MAELPVDAEQECPAEPLLIAPLDEVVVCDDAVFGPAAMQEIHRID